MKTKFAIRLCACVLAVQLLGQLACQPAVARDGPDRPVAIRKVNSGLVVHAKPSSLAPRPHSKRSAYGAPISRPILGRRKPAPPKKPGVSD